MKIAILGNGGRENALAYQVYKSRNVSKIYCLPGNAGTKKVAENIDINIENFNEILNFIKKMYIDLVIVGPEKPLVGGITDFLKENNVSVFGPGKFVSQLEGSKIFTKEICKKYDIPTANFGVFKSEEGANNFLDKSNFPIVIKADGLAAGKGVYICKNLGEAKKATKEVFDGKFGLAKEILVEEFLDGEEMSYFIISDGLNYKSFNTAQDHKRVGEGDIGKNTGGMGAYSPSGLINKELEKKILERIIEPTLKAIKDMGKEYVGFLYAGLMIKNNNPYLIEYNVRMGDPECQTILPLLKSDFMSLILATVNKKLKDTSIEWHNKKSLCIVLCSKGYPDHYEKNIEVCKEDSLSFSEDNFIFHAGTKLENNKIFAIGGRVLNFVSVSESFLLSRKKIIKDIQKLNWKEGYFRSDIGYRIINK